MLYLVIVNYHCEDLIKKQLNSLRKANSLTKKIIIIDNSNNNKSLILSDFPSSKIKLIKSMNNIGFGGGCNLGLKYIYSLDSKAFVWLLNPDTFFSLHVLNQALSFLEEYPEISILGTLIYSSDQNLWFTRGLFNTKTGAISSQKFLNSSFQKPYYICDWVSGCSMIINLNNFEECPQFDPNYFLYYEDFDFCQRYKRQGHLVAVTQEISITHEVSAVTNRNLKKKFYHSTYSYLFTLERYTTKTVFYLRLIRLLIYALILLLVKPAIALGKITGAWHYFRQRLSGVTPFIN